MPNKHSGSVTSQISPILETLGEHNSEDTASNPAAPLSMSDPFQHQGEQTL